MVSSGTLTSFRTPAVQPINSLKVYIKPTQSGSGDPSPTNIRPLSGLTGLSAKICGKNLFNENYADITENDVVQYRSIYVGDGTFTMSTTCERYGTTSSYAKELR